MKKKLKLAIILFGALVSLVIIFNITGKITENSSATTGDELVTCPGYSCSGAYIIDYDENGCPIYECPSCEEGSIKKYTCPDGTKVDWCHCSNSLWVCVNSPENACSLQTCSMPVCGDVEPHFTGKYDEDNCPVYECPGMECSPGLKSEYVCPDGTSVPDCECSEDGRWICLTNPEWQCPTPVCPEGCICNENTITCVYGEAMTETSPVSSGGEAGGVSAEVCPAGCLCTDNSIVCEQNLTAKGKCAMGCEFGETCVLPGIRTTIENSKKYCDIDSEWKVQKTKEESCDNNFECETNLCINGKCITQGFLDKIFEWFRNLFGGE
jgi:hypothetical protein